jgi:hypothetical protein
MIALLLALILAWNDSSSSDVAGFLVWWGLDSGATTNFLDAGDNLTLTIANESFPYKTPIYFRVTAYDSAGRQSGPSNEVSWRRPRGKKPN